MYDWARGEHWKKKLTDFEKNMADAIGSVGLHKFFILNTQQATKTNLQRLNSEFSG